MKLKELLNKNMKRLRKLKSLTQDELAEKYGCNRSFIAQLETGQNNPSLSVLERLAEVLGVDESEIFRMAEESEFESEHAFIPLYKVRAANGLEGIVAGDGPEVEEHLPFKRRWLVQMGYNPDMASGRLALIRTRGDSMAPTICDGEVILTDLHESVRIPDNIKSGHVYVLRWGVTQDELSVKRVHIDWAARTIYATSDNPLWTKKEIVLSEEADLKHTILGKVIWVGKEKF